MATEGDLNAPQSHFARQLPTRGEHDTLHRTGVVPRRETRAYSADRFRRAGESAAILAFDHHFAGERIGDEAQLV